MTCELSVLPGERVVLSSFSGPITVKDRVRNQRETLQFCQKKKINKILLDMRGQESLSNIADLHDFGASMPETTRGFQIAIVCDSGDANARFIDTVAANRGAHINSFHSIEKAREWLEPSDEKTPSTQDSQCPRETR